jgi:phosphatidylethanolamine/phosphatidyl-N-methylethanolamine N-methyltransferase
MSGKAQAKRTSSPMSEHWEFLRGLIASPKGVGAIAPSSPALARAIANEVDPARDGPILELGPGTGVVTEALIERGIAPGRITAVEFDRDFATRVRERCPGVQVIEGDAFDLSATLRETDNTGFAAIISGIPLLNWPVSARRGLIDDAFARLQPGAPFVQFSYGLTPPVAATDTFTVRRAAVIWVNLPPARVWVYSRR